MNLSIRSLMELEKERGLAALDYEGENGDEGWCKAWATKTWGMIQGVGGELCPVAPYVLLKDLPQDEETRPSGIILPGTKREHDVTKALVIATPKNGIPIKRKDGKFAGVRDCLVSTGDTVIYEKFRGTDIMIKGEPFVLLDEGVIIGTLDNRGE